MAAKLVGVTEEADIQGISSFVDDRLKAMGMPGISKPKVAILRG